jgi:hypothetical protein
MKKKLALFLVISLLACITVNGQNSTQGTEFWFSFMENGYKYNNGNWVENNVMISAKQACTGTISKPDGSLPPIPFSVGSNGITYINIPEEYAYNEDNSEQVGYKSLVLRATDTVSVFLSNIATYSFDASFVLPVESLGSEYFIQCFDQETSSWDSPLSDEIFTSAFLIVAVEDNTIIDIIPSVLTEHDLAFPGETATVVLNAGETYFVKSNYGDDWRDLSGTHIMAYDDKRIAVFNGNTTTCIPTDVGNGRDHIFEQALPADSWGQQFAVTTSQGRVRDFVKITSSGDDNLVKCDGQAIATLSRGESFVFDLNASIGSCFIETTMPSVVYLYNTTGEEPLEPYGSNNGDPSMAWIPPVEQRIDEITFCTFDSDYEYAHIDSHYVNIVVESDDVGRVYFDGALISANDFEPVIGTSGYSYVRKSINHGTHHLSCATGLIAHVYGFGQARGYAYCVGANVISLKQKLFVNGVWSGFYHDGLYMCVDESADMAVETNYHINEVSWTYGDGQTGQGVEVTHQYASAGNYVATAYINGTNEFTMETVFDTLSVDIHVGEPEHHVLDTAVCDLDAFDYYGMEYVQSGHYERVGTSIYGCDSTFILTLDMEFTPDFEFVGTHWPIGGSETHISVNEYSIHTLEPRTRLDTVLWQIDCPNWYVVPHGDKGKECSLYIFSYLLEPVTLHAWTINRCDTVHEEFFIKTSYFDLGEYAQDADFVISPNPTHGSMTLNFSDLQGIVEVQVFNSQGQEVDAFVLDLDQRREFAYAMTGCRNGLYYFLVKNKGKTLIQKVVLSQ